MEVYLVSAGRHDMYRVIGVYTDKAVADKLANAFEYGNVTPYELNEKLSPEIEAGNQFYFVQMKQDKVSYCAKSDPIYNDSGHLYYGSEDFSHIALWAQDEEDAKSKALAALDSYINNKKEDGE